MLHWHKKKVYIAEENHILTPQIAFNLIWYGIVGFNVPIDTL